MPAIDTTQIQPSVTAPRAIIDRWIADLNDALAAANAARAATLFGETSFWRDLVAFTWNIKTVEHRAGIEEMLTATLPNVGPVRFAVESEADARGDVIEARLTFETRVGRGDALVRLRNGEGWTMFTSLTELKGFEERRGPTRIKGAEHGVVRGRRSWSERRQDEYDAIGKTAQPYVVVIGGGQGGIVLGARLRQLGVPHIVLDRHPRAGDQWRSRYKSLSLHDPVWFDHLPYLDFPANWPIFTPKDKMGDWLEMYAKVMEVTYWGDTTALGADYDETRRQWNVRVQRGSEFVLLEPAHLVLATGVSGKPNIPVFPGMDAFAGEQHHSSAHPGPDAYVGKKVVVIGSNNSAHDICAALWEAGADVTMVQRSSTHILRSQTMLDIVNGESYSESALSNGITTRIADMGIASIPYRIMPEFMIPIYERVKKHDAAFYDALQKAGFQVDFGSDDSGLFVKYVRRGSGYYIDVGASDLVIDGSIKLKSGVAVDRITRDGVHFEDGTELAADLIVYATGYSSMNDRAAELISEEVAEKVGKVWGIGSDTPKDPGPWEGEIRNMWKPTQQNGLWFHGGNLYETRNYSLPLALQLKARFEKLETPIYGLQPVHHHH